MFGALAPVSVHLAAEHSIRARCDASNRGRDLKPSCDDGGHASVVL